MTSGVGCAWLVSRVVVVGGLCLCLSVWRLCGRLDCSFCVFEVVLGRFVLWLGPLGVIVVVACFTGCRVVCWALCAGFCAGLCVPGFVCWVYVLGCVLGLFAGLCAGCSQL